MTLIVLILEILPKLKESIRVQISKKSTGKGGVNQVTLEPGAAVPE